MKQIKTIARRANYSEEFDEAVNAALAEGWVLTKREVIQAVEGPTLIFHRMLYAELEREIVEKEGPIEFICETCAHFDVLSPRPPCYECLDKDKWEPRS